ncbi:MAG: rod shape-determining protein MreD [Planctomycetota bacterium]|nr:rod shape-determining protein MreD [Planctomycetota bacterium]
MSLVVLLALMLIAAALPDLMPEVLSIHRHPPDLWAVAVLYIAFRARGFRAVGWAIAIGAARDCVSLDPLGTHAFVLGTTAFFFCEGRSSRGRIEGPTRVALTGLGVLVAGWIYLLRILPLGGGVVTFGAFVAAVPVALWSALLAAGLYALLDRTKALDEVCGRTRAFPA